VRFQIRTLLTEKPPLRIISPGGVYRSDSDVSHSPHFHQIEGLLIDKNVSLADLKGVLAYFAREFFGPEIQVRLRPSYFPFVEPGAEVDASCPLCKAKGCSMCKGTGWLELAGCGMVHPQVFKNVGLEYPQWNGFAFGMGVERMAVVKYGISHLNLFYENDLRFLEPFRL
jgi:phenylalanyl-tRNA synthetase alpha chain